MKKLFFVSAILIAQLHAFAVVDTLRHANYNKSKVKLGYFFNGFTTQYACFNSPAPGFVQSIILTLDGPKGGTVTVHLYGNEGGDAMPSFEKDLMDSIVFKKNILGIERVKVNLPAPVRLDKSLFFLKMNHFSSNVHLIIDTTTTAPYCSSASGGYYHHQYIFNATNGYYVDNAFAIDMVMDYTEGITSPKYFKDITAAAGIDTTLYNYFIAWADINKDGYLDLLVNGKLYKNMGNSTFTDITASAGITSSGSSTFIDMNNDGKDDILFLQNGGANFIYVNNGNETFTQHALNLTTPNFSSLATYTIGDFNNDKYPDLFVGQVWTSVTLTSGTTQTYIESDLPHYLYMNDKNLGFIDTSSLIVPSYINSPSLVMQNGQEVGWDTTLKYGKIIGTTRCVRGAQFVDYNDDGQLDLYVANYRAQPDELWRNNGDGTFTDVCKSLGIDINTQGGNGQGTGCDWADYDNDGNIDLLLPQLAHPRFIVPYDMRPTTIYKNNGDGTFTDMNPGVDQGLGIQYEETHAGAAWGDLNNDGLLDFGISVFYGCRYADVYLQKPDHTFEMQSFNFGVRDISAAEDLALVDYDNDGRLDMAYGINPGEAGASFRLFKNTGPFWDHYVELDLVSTSGNTDAVGAKVTVYAGGKVYTRYQMPYHGAFMSKGNRIHIGLSTATSVDSVFVRWPNGTTNSEKFTGLAINNYNILTEGGTVTLGVKQETKFLSSVNVYPNPASNEVSFNYELAVNAAVTLDIYSILGEKMNVINNENQTAGQHIVQWNMKDKVAPGIYSYRLQAGELQKTGLLVVQ